MVSSSRLEIINTIENAKRRDEVVPEYADLIRRGTDVTMQQWRDVNMTIIDRWSKSAVEYIKRQAWKRIHSERRVSHASEGLPG
jgi:hypothetical protein